MRWSLGGRCGWESGLGEPVGPACPGSELTRLWTPQFQQGSPGKTGPRGGVVSASNLPSRHHPLYLHPPPHVIRASLASHRGGGARVSQASAASVPMPCGATAI